MYPTCFFLSKNSLATAFLLITSLLVLSTTGCSLRSPTVSGISEREQTCLGFFKHLQSAINEHTYIEASVRPINGYPIYRSDRFHASFADQLLSKAEHLAWITALRKNAIDAYKLEVTRLPKHIQQKLTHIANNLTINDAIAQCSSDLQAYFLEKETHAPLSPARLSINDNYSNVLRIFGLYAVTKFLAQPSIEAYQADMITRYERGQKTNASIEIYKPLKRTHLSAQHIQNLLSNAYTNNALGIPQLSPAQIATLFSHFSPILSIETANNSDRIGSPLWQNHTNIFIDTRKPRLFTFPSYTRYKGQSLLQLNYAFWFPERPPQTGFDIYAGALDGLIWRITLNTQGQPFLYDSIHQCGCYHKVFVPHGLSYQHPSDATESPLFFNINVDTSQPVILDIDSASHYIVGVSQSKTPLRSNPVHNITTYDMTDYSALSQTVDGQGIRSIFNADGIIEQSSRKERWFLWPLGVVNAGAMRQRGNHAIAFIGRRHFDDAFFWEAFRIEKSPHKIK